jgi:hypothetical protein
MKRFAAVLAVVALVGVPYAAACDKDKQEASLQAAGTEGAGKEVTLTGYLTDSYCGAANASAKGKSCAIDCIKKGAKVQLYANNTLYTLDKADAIESKIGIEVKVTGMLDEATNTIKVGSIETVKKG